MSRGIDFKGVNLVINYDFPQTTVSYIHRIGRAGRAGRQGEAITYFTKQDAEYLRGFHFILFLFSSFHFHFHFHLKSINFFLKKNSIANVMKESGCDIPDWMLALPKPKYLDLFIY